MGFPCIVLTPRSFRSPQLLMVSGIGPRETLEGLDTKVLADLNGVGQNMWVRQRFHM